MHVDTMGLVRSLRPRVDAGGGERAEAQRGKAAGHEFAPAKR
jgi:hypothetical protein